MAFDSLQDRLGSDTSLTPMSIAHNGHFTPKEKLELLTQLKADVAVAQQEGMSPVLSLKEIDQAIAEVRKDVENGIGTETLVRGDN